MRAAYYESKGPAARVLRLGELPRPTVGPGDVLVRVHASGVNPSDVKKRLGAMPAPADFSLIVPHSDGAGVIEAVGAAVDSARVGERVWLWNAQWQRPYGTAAAYCALPAEQAVRLPDLTSFAEGACLGIPAQTAWVAVMDGRPGPGKTVLVQGGAGAVGALAIAIARDAGAEVIATVSSAEKARIARLAGAGETLNYREDDIADAVLTATGGKGVDHVVDVDFGANWQVNARVLARNGSIAAYSAPSRPCFELDYYAFAAKAARLRFVQVYLLIEGERRRAVEGVTALAARAKLPIRVAGRFALEEIVAAHEAQESGARIGNIIVEMTGGGDADT